MVRRTEERQAHAGSGTALRPGPMVERARPEPCDGKLVAVVVPTYNEAENLPELARRLFRQNIGNLILIVVDDNSPDGTAGVAHRLEQQFDGRVQLLLRNTKQGLGTAYVAGFTHALAEGAEYIVQMDADLSHPPESLPGLLHDLETADVVVGSRYVGEGGVDERWSLPRRLLSVSANLGIRTVSGLKVNDATSGFKGFRREALSKVDLTKLRSKGFAFQAEMIHACQRRGYRIVEHPFRFANRVRGSSKMSIYIAVEALWRLASLRWKK